MKDNIRTIINARRLENMTTEIFDSVDAQTKRCVENICIGFSFNNRVHSHLIKIFDTIKLNEWII